MTIKLGGEKLVFYVYYTLRKEGPTHFPELINISPSLNLSLENEKIVCTLNTFSRSRDMSDGSVRWREILVPSSSVAPPVFTCLHKVHWDIKEY